MKHLALTVGSFFLMVAGIAAADSPSVSISTGKRFSMALVGRTANIVLAVRFVKHEGNRDIEVSCNGVDGGIYASSGKSLAGGNEDRKTFDFAFNLTPATYRCEAVLKRVVGGKKKEFTSFVEVTVH